MTPEAKDNHEVRSTTNTLNALLWASSNAAAASDLLTRLHNLMSRAADFTPSELEDYLSAVEKWADYEARKIIAIREPTTSTRLDTLELSIRAANALEKGGIDSIEKLVRLSEDELYRFKWIGEHTAREIKYKMRAKGLGFGMVYPIDAA